MDTWGQNCPQHNSALSDWTDSACYLVDEQSLLAGEPLEMDHKKFTENWL